MTDENTSAYYKRREQQERDLAVTAIDQCAKAAHLEMAERYASYTRENVSGVNKSIGRADQRVKDTLAS